MDINALKVAGSFKDVAVNTAVPKCRAVYIGVSQSLDFSVDGTVWVTFKGLAAGTIIPVSVVAV